MRVTMPLTRSPTSSSSGISSRALFDLEHENRLFDAQGVEAFSCYQREHEDETAAPAPAFPLVQALLGLNALLPERRISGGDLAQLARHRPARLQRDPGRTAWRSSAQPSPAARSLVGYLKTFDVDLFLSRNPGDVRRRSTTALAAALLYDPPADFRAPAGQIRIAFDGDAVLFRRVRAHPTRRRGWRPSSRTSGCTAMTRWRRGPSPSC